MSTGVRRVLIVDDEPAARAQLRDVIEELPELEVIEELKDGSSAIEAIVEHAPHVVFLDIDMPEVDGFAVARATEHIPYQLVFVTAHHQYALEAFDTHAIDYLLKPARPSLIKKCLAKILHQEVLTLHMQAEASAPTSLLLTDGRENRVIDMDHVLCIEGLGRYRRIHLSADGTEVHKQETVLSDTTLDEFTAQLGDKSFMRVHRSYVVNLTLVTSLKSTGRQYAVSLAGAKEEIPVARARVKALKVRLGRAHKKPP
jgi:DNA-binding LytR/AlgR family response regulator